MISDHDLYRWTADPVKLAQECYLRRPDGKVAKIRLSQRQKGVLRALAAGEPTKPKYKTVVWVAPKRSGKTLLAALALIWKSLAPDRFSVCLSNSERQSQSATFRKAAEIIRRTPKLREEAEIQSTTIRFSWGAAISTIPCNPGTAAGIEITGLLVSDELWAAQAAGEESFALLSSQAEAQAAQVFLISQPSGHLSTVYKLWEQSTRPDADPTVWVDRVVFPSLEDAAENYPSPFVTAAYLRNRLAQDPARFRQFFLGEWGTPGQPLFAPEDVEACFESDLRLPRSKQEFRARYPSVTVGAGLDRTQPYSGSKENTAWVGVAREGYGAEAQFSVVACEVISSGAEAQIMNAAQRTQAICRPCLTLVEAYQSADLATRLPGRVELRHATAPAQQGLFGRLARLVAEGRLHVPAECEQLRVELLTMQVNTDAGQYAKFDHPSGGTSDVVFALAWALEAADSGVPAPSWVFAPRSDDYGDDVAPRRVGLYTSR